MSYVLECAKAYYTALRVPGQFLYDMSAVVDGAVCNATHVQNVAPARTVHYALISKAVHQLREDHASLAGADIHSIDTSWSMGAETYARLGESHEDSLTTLSSAEDSSSLRKKDSLPGDFSASLDPRERKVKNKKVSREEALTLLDQATNLVGEEAAEPAKILYSLAAAFEEATVHQHALEEKLKEHTRRKRKDKMEFYTTQVNSGKLATEEARAALHAALDKETRKLYMGFKRRYAAMCVEIRSALTWDSDPLANFNIHVDNGASTEVSSLCNSRADVKSSSTSNRQTQEITETTNYNSKGKDRKGESQKETESVAGSLEASPPNNTKCRMNAHTTVVNLSDVRSGETLPSMPPPHTEEFSVEALHAVEQQLSNRNNHIDNTSINASTEEDTKGPHDEIAIFEEEGKNGDMWFRFFFFDRLKNSTEKLPLAYSLCLYHFLRIGRKSGYTYPEDILNDIRHTQQALNSVSFERRRKDFDRILGGIFGYRKSIEQLRLLVRDVKEAEKKLEHHTREKKTRKVEKWTAELKKREEAAKRGEKELFVDGAEDMFDFYDTLIKFIDNYIQKFLDVLQNKSNNSPSYSYYCSARPR